MSEETVIRILKDVARISIPEDDCGYWCPLCKESSINSAYSEIDELKHQPNCAILLARKELRERGMFVRVYRVTGEYVCAKTRQGKQWGPFQEYTLIVHKEDMEEWKSANRRNVQFAFVRELTPEEGGA